MNRVESVNTGLAMQPFDGPVAVHPHGLEGHAAPDAGARSLGRAIYAYPAEHYPFWQTVRSQAGLAEWGTPLVHGALGEHLTITGLVETQAFVGDLLKFAHCTLAVSAPHDPGPELNVRMGFPHATRLMTQSAWCGFWLAVRVPGRIRAGERYELIPGPREVGIAELIRARKEPARN